MLCSLASLGIFQARRTMLSERMSLAGCSLVLYVILRLVIVPAQGAISGQCL